MSYQINAIRCLRCLTALFLLMLLPEAESHAQYCRRFIYRPEPFTSASRGSVNLHMATQARNGQVLTQTMWNYHFREETAELHPLGVAHLNRLARRYWNCPLELFVQAAQDIAYDAESPEEFVKARHDLDAKRAETVMRYMATVAGHEGVTVAVHNPPSVGMSAAEASIAVQDMLQRAPRGYLTAEAVAKGSIESSTGGFGTTLQPDLGGAGVPFGTPSFGGDVPVGDVGGGFGGDFDAGLEGFDLEGLIP